MERLHEHFSKTRGFRMRWESHEPAKEGPRLLFKLCLRNFYFMADKVKNKNNDVLKYEPIRQGQGYRK